MFKNIFISILLFFNVFLINFSFVNADYLDDAFENAQNNQIINEEIKEKKVKEYVQNITKTMLKISIIIWVIVFLYGWIRFLLSLGDDTKAKKTRDTLIVSWIWLIISFWSYIILQLILSIWNTL